MTGNKQNEIPEQVQEYVKNINSIGFNWIHIKKEKLSKSYSIR